MGEAEVTNAVLVPVHKSIVDDPQTFPEAEAAALEAFRRNLHIEPESIAWKVLDGANMRIGDPPRTHPGFVFVRAEAREWHHL